MSCDARWLAVLAIVGACAPVDAPVTQLTATATEVVNLDPNDSNTIGDVFHFTVVSRPPDSHAQDPDDSDVGAFIPDLPGAYLVDASLTQGVADDLVRRFAIDAADAPPIARIIVTQAAATAPVIADGTRSESPDNLPLTYLWRLASRPEGSTAILSSVSEPMTSLVPDEAGDYTIELDVFDGELWSAPASVTTPVPAP